MTTLAKNSPRRFVVGERNHLDVVASDIVYEGAAVGLVKASGHARPLSAGDKFAGFAMEKIDNSAGSAADLQVEVAKRGVIQLSVTGAVITDVGQPVYASDDDTFVFTPTGNSFVGFIRRFEAAGVVHVEFNAGVYQDPYAGYVVETVSVDKTLDIEDNGKLIWVDTDAKTITMPAIATPVHCTIVNGGAYGTVAVNISPNASDMIHAPDIAGTDDKDHINTKATAQRGDLVSLEPGDAAGWVVTRQIGVWAQEAG